MSVSDSTKAQLKKKLIHSVQKTILEEKNARTVNKLTLYTDQQKYPIGNDSNLWIVTL